MKKIFSTRTTAPKAVYAANPPLILPPYIPYRTRCNAMKQRPKAYRKPSLPPGDSNTGPTKSNTEKVKHGGNYCEMPLLIRLPLF